MPAEKSDAIVIRLADFSESSKIVTLFSRDFGKVAAIAKGAKRLKSSFEAALDLLSECRVVFLRKSSGLDILTEAQLLSRFRTNGQQLNNLYGGYYVAELLDGLTEEHDPHPDLYAVASQTLTRLAAESDPRPHLIHFELSLLRELGHLPNLDECSLCHQQLSLGAGGRFWVSQGGLICNNCGRPEFEHSALSGGAIAILRRLAAGTELPANRVSISPSQYSELRRFLTAAICHLLERRPKMLKYLSF